jgi:glutathione synthase/RimK-type ligase-like ATP-grasp enzyme
VRIALIHTDAAHYLPTGYADAWTRALGELGAEVDRLPRVPDDWGASGPPAGRWALGIPHVLVEEVVACAPTFRVASLLEAAGLPLLNPVNAIVASSDKLVTHAVWAAHGIDQPRAWDLARLGDRWPAAAGRPMVLKPAFCDGARHIELVASLEEAREIEAAWREDEARGGEVRGAALLQEWIEEPATVRLFATPDRVSLAYEKSRVPGELVTHGTVYPKVYEAPPEMEDLARRMVSSLGGGLMGVDVLTDAAGRHWALEANAPFGFDVTDPEQGRFVAEAALERAGAVPAPAR